MSPHRHNPATSILITLPALAIMFIAVHLLAQDTPGRGHDFLERIHDWLDDFVQGNILPLYVNDGTGGQKLKQD
jgi:hypothetical protein